MKKCAFFWVVFVILVCQVGPVTDAQADVVGRLTQVEGRVDILRGGQLPATPVKVDDGVQTGDVLRTKSLSKAQITFIDNTTLAIAPESRVAIEEYMFDPAKQKRSATIQLFQGLAHVVVSKLFKSAEPDFVVKTQTAIMGIRGTEFGIRLQPNGSTILNFEGVLQVGSIFPEVGQLSRKAFKVAYSSSHKWGESGHGWVQVHQWQGTFVGSGLPPTVPFSISLEEWRHFLHQMGSGLNLCRRRDAGADEAGGGAPSETISSCAATTGDQGTGTGGGLGGLSPGFLKSLFSLANTPPNNPRPNETAAPTTSAPNETAAPNSSAPVTPSTYNFSLSTYGAFLQSACSASTPTGFLAASAVGGASPVLITAGGLAVLQGELKNILPTFYLATDSSTFAPTSGAFPSRKVLGVYTATMVGSVSGVLGNTLTGTATLQSSYISLRYQLSNSATIQVTIDPSSGKITYTYISGSFAGVIGGTAISGTSSGSGTATPLFASITGTSTTAASGTMTAMAASTGSTVVTNNDQLGGSLAPVNPAGSKGSLAGTTSMMPMTGHHQGAGPGPTITNFNLTSAITNSAVHLPKNFQGKDATLGRGGAGNPRGHHAGPAPAVHSLKDKSPPKGHTQNGGPVNPGLHGGASGPPQGPMTGPAGAPKPGGGA